MPPAHRLSDNQLARAVAANPRWRERLGADWPTDAQFMAADVPVLRGVGDFEFAEAVAAYQARKGLAFDGICGKVTANSVRGLPGPLPMGRPILIVDGLELPAPGCRVVTWKDPDGLGFHDQPALWRPRSGSAPMDLFVLHHDGCRSSRQCYDVLVHRGLSVHLLLDRDGTIYQTLDLKTAQAFHAGPGANERSVGVEICNPERSDRNDPRDPRPVVTLEVTNAGAQGALRQVLGYYPAQVVAITQLARAVAAIFQLPLQLPRATSSTSAAGITRGLDPRVTSGQFRGVCGHYHLKESKVDPGVSLWPPLRAAGFVPG
jgi:hypothetical protein